MQTGKKKTIARQVLREVLRVVFDMAVFSAEALDFVLKFRTLKQGRASFSGGLDFTCFSRKKCLVFKRE